MTTTRSDFWDTVYSDNLGDPSHSADGGVFRSYTELCRYTTLEYRFEYLKFYHSREWTEAKEAVIIRDRGYDLGVPGWKIVGTIYVHHMNPVTLQQLKDNDPILTDPENLISCSYNTHQAITWGNKLLLPQPIVVRQPNDMCPWK